MSVKYRQIASINSTPFIKEDDDRGRNNTLVESSLGFKESPSKYAEIKNLNENIQEFGRNPLLKKDKETIKKEN